MPRVRDLAMKIWNSWPKTCEQYTSDFQISNPFTTIGRPVQEFPLSNLSSLWQPLKFFSRLFHRMVNQNFSLLFFFAKVSYWKFGVEIFKDIVSISSYPSSGEIWRWHWLDEMQNIQWFSVWYYSEIRNDWNWNTYDLLTYKFIYKIAICVKYFIIHSSTGSSILYCSSLLTTYACKLAQKKLKYVW